MSNLALAAGGCTVLAGLVEFSHGFAAPAGEPPIDAAAYQFLQLFVLINVLLACFNLLPIPPLDGSRIVDALVPDWFRPYWSRFTAISPVLLAVVVLMPIFAGVSILAWPLEWVAK